MSANCFFIATSWTDTPVSTHFKALAKTLTKRGHQVHLLVDGLRHDIEDRLANPAVHTWPSIRPVKLQDARFLHGLIKQYQPDCLIANFGASNIMMSVGWLSGVSCRVNWYHTLSTAIEFDNQSSGVAAWLLRLRKRFIYRLATHLIANSQAALKDAQDVFHIPDRKCRVFYNTLSDPLKQQIVPPEDRTKNRLICVGRFYPTKGQDVLIKALPLLKQADLCVEFVGSGPWNEQYEQLARSLNIRHRCLFTGVLPHAQVLEKMAAAVAVVVPSRSEAFGLVNIEALAVGTPVIASQVGGIREIIRDGVDGFLVPADDPQKLAEKIDMLCSNPALRAEMGANARQRFLSQFELDKMVQQQAVWFEQLVAGKVCYREVNN